MTLSTRLLTRVSIACAATALALSACSSKHTAENPTTPTPTTSAPASTPAETTPAPGKWTLEDLKVGAKVPKEDLERLFPKWEIPEPPATLTEFSEQGAKDAAIYYDRLTDIAVFYNDPALVNQIDNGECENCANIRTGASTPASGYIAVPDLEHATLKPFTDTDSIYEVKLSLKYPTSITMDAEGKAISRVTKDKILTLFTYVGFIDNQWKTIYIKLDESVS